MTIRELLPHLIATALLACLPFLGISNTALNFLIVVLITALAAQGWNILGGFGGQYSFGHAAFFGTGAYTTAILQVRLGWGAWPSFLLGVLAGTLTGFIIGFLSFRANLRGSYFALVTLAFAEVCRIVANAIGITGGAANVLPVVRSIHDEGVTILMVEHIMQAVMTLCERVHVLAQGRIIASGPPREVCADPVVIEAYLGAGAAGRHVPRGAANA
jgi:ABC-type branched-subunit amino acid transport system permease subunit